MALQQSQLPSAVPEIAPKTAREPPSGSMPMRRRQHKFHIVRMARPADRLLEAEQFATTSRIHQQLLFVILSHTSLP